MIVIETEYMKVEIVPLDIETDDPLYGRVTWKGEELRVTVKEGLIGDTALLDKSSTQYIGLVTEKPTTIFTLGTPERE